MTDKDIKKFVQECKRFKEVLVKEDVDQNLVNSCTELIQDATEPLMLMIMGEFSMGKSTFINALLGEEVAIINNTPTTAVITKICYGPKEKLLIHYKDGHDEDMPLQKFKEMTSGATEADNELHGRIAYVERRMPLAMLRKLTIIDSPGLNAPVEEHTQATHSFIGKADVVFWMFSADQPIKQSELDAMKKLDLRLKPVAIMNKMDMIDEEEDDPEEFLQDNYAKIKDKVQTMIGISAKFAFDGQQQGDKELEETGGLQQIHAFIQKNILPNREEYKRNTLLDDLNGLASNLHYYQQPIVNILDDLKGEDYSDYMAEKERLVRIKNQFLTVIDPFYRYVMLHAKRNSTEATFLGLLYTFDYLGEHDTKKGLSFLEEAATMNDAKAQNYLSWFLLMEQKDADKAFYWAEKAAETGNDDAEVTLGLMYENGLGTKPDTEKALQYYQKAAKQGNADGMFDIAKYYLNHHIEDKQDEAVSCLEKAAIAGSANAMYYWATSEQCKEPYQWLKKAANKGNDDAQNSLGLALSNNGKEAEGLSLIRKAALQGNSDAQGNLGEIYRDGLWDVKQDWRKSERWYRRAVEQGDNYARIGLADLLLQKKDASTYKEELLSLLTDAADENYNPALLRLGYLYRDASDNLVTQNETKALSYFEQAAKNGDAEGALEAGELYIRKKDYKKALTYLKQAKDADKAGAFICLAMLYQNGAGVTKDLEKAFSYFKYAADKGEEYACVQVANCYWNDIGITNNHDKAVHYYEIAFEKSSHKNADAAFGLARCYHYGIGIEKNEIKAKQFLKTAANLGNGEAMNRMGLEEQDVKKAHMWYQKSAEAGFEWGMYNVGIDYQTGRGTAEDEGKAHHWFVLAAKQGLTEAFNRAGLTSSDRKEEIKWYLKAGKAGDGWGYNNRGLCYEWYDKDFQLAKKYYLLSIESNGDSAADSLYHLGCLYADGKLGRDEDKTALEYLKKAKDKGNKDADAKIKEINDKLVEIERKKEEERRKHQLAEEARKKHLQEVRAISRNVNPDWIKDYEASLSRNNTQGYYALGCLYAEGEYLEQDLDKAKEFLTWAEQYGHPYASEELQSLHRKKFGRTLYNIFIGAPIAVISGILTLIGYLLGAAIFLGGIALFIGLLVLIAAL